MRAVALVLAMLLVSATGAAARGTAAVPKRIALPAGFQPEGIATAGGRGAMLVKPQSGRAAIGVDVDSGRLFVAGGPTGKAFVYDARTGGSLAALQLATGRDTFVNDVVVTRRAAWFTDSSNDVLYRVPLAADGRPGSADDGAGREAHGRFQARRRIQRDWHRRDFGRDAARDRPVEHRPAVHGRPRDRRRPGGSTSARRACRTVTASCWTAWSCYGVQNQLNVVAKIALRRDLRSGRILRRLGDPTLDVPTTIDEQASWLYAVNARFGTSATATTKYWVTRLPK
jgi:hypothetical protein